VARRLAAALDGARQLPPFTLTERSFDVAAAYEVLARMHAWRIESGYRPIGRKVGFTNRSIWARYGVDRPMWSHVWDRTVGFWPDGEAQLSIEGLCEPRIEPEVVFGLRGAPGAGHDARTLLSAVEWVAPGFEIVHSVYPGWKFGAADCTAQLGLHGRLAVGPRRVLDDRARLALAEALPAMHVSLLRDGVVADTGVGANVLDSPALAIAWLRDLLARQPGSPPLAAGEVVTTGTLTDAQPVAAGERWRATFDGAALPAFEARIVGA
jgi:2-oxo-3-hexenedioate decarboxylase